MLALGSWIGWFCWSRVLEFHFYTLLILVCLLLQRECVHFWGFRLISAWCTTRTPSIRVSILAPWHLHWSSKRHYPILFWDIYVLHSFCQQPICFALGCRAKLFRRFQFVCYSWRGCRIMKGVAAINMKIRNLYQLSSQPRWGFAVSCETSKICVVWWYAQEGFRLRDIPHRNHLVIGFQATWTFGWWIMLLN